MNITEFIILGFGNFGQWQSIIFFIFLVFYIVAMAGNILIVILVAIDQRLHTPMYFFLGNLSCLETCYISNILPKMMVGFLTDENTISFNGCFLQFFCFGLLVATECYLLSVMSYDRYLAICKPLHYATNMNARICIQLAAFSWINGLIAALILLSLMLQLTFCGQNEINHYFCDTLPLIKLSCSDTNLVEFTSFSFTFVFTLPPFILTVTSYIYIIITILRIPSTIGRKKAFSTCSSHLIVVSMFYGAIMIVYLLPKSEALSEVSKVFSLLYTVLPPVANPLIYSLRNKEVKDAMKKISKKFIPFRFYRGQL
ncbi:PREDICTED: olfactory receptor 1038-like [Thamnophis sirtalis]|uniref:Olfactory receptor n=1 Tax=Thamnophis sirtalis TaxID=35019 RepID=A0A6I9Y204_9SAUR|nr:PREDICTED: olfactory receptor 1038-like [Thamnophis sirtalis]